VNPRTDEERAVLRSEAALSQLVEALPKLEASAAEAQAALAELTRSLPPVKERAQQSELDAQAAEGQATQARSAEVVAAARLQALTAPLGEKEGSAASAEQEHARRKAVAAEVLPALDEALTIATAAEETLRIFPEDLAAQAAHSASTEELTRVMALNQLAELEVARARVLAHAAEKTLFLWRERLEAHASDHKSLMSIADEKEAVAMNERATANDADAELSAFLSKLTQADGLFVEANESLANARDDQAKHTSLLESARPRWEELQEALVRTNGRVQQAPN
jgi:chromosome segregation ATPase